jgi:hypothetical protein
MVYPNPCLDGVLTLKLPASSTDYIHVSLFSVNGALIYSGSYKMNGQELKLNFDPFWTDSMYVLHIDWNGNSFYKKIIAK